MFIAFDHEIHFAFDSDVEQLREFRLAPTRVVLWFHPVRQA
jgi:hypothetical protein